MSLTDLKKACLTRLFAFVDSAEDDLLFENAFSFLSFNLEITSAEELELATALR